MELKFFKKTIPTLIFFVVFSAIALTVFYHLLKVDNHLKIYNPVDVNPRLVDDSMLHIQKNHTIADFKLLNQNGKIITNKDYQDKIYVADFFFTRCQTICIAMAYNMSELQSYYKNDNDIMFLSHSVTPVIDSVSVLKAYADKKGVIDVSQKGWDPGPTLTRTKESPDKESPDKETIINHNHYHHQPRHHSYGYRRWEVKFARLEGCIRNSTRNVIVWIGFCKFFIRIKFV